MTLNASLTSAEAARVLVVSESFHDLPAARRVLEEAGCQVTYIWPPVPLSELSAEQVAQADAIVMGRVLTSPAELGLARRARVVALHTSGHDNIDIAAASNQGVLVTNVRGVNAEVCADFGMGLILAASRQIVLGDKSIRGGHWFSKTISSPDVSGATLGVIGLGLIGKALVRRAEAFDMRILAFTRTPDHDFAARYGVEYVPLDTLLESADVVSLTTSLSPSNVGMIGERELRLMKPSAVLVNIARGELIDEAALYQALKGGWIAGAGLDVFCQEPLTSSPFFELDNVVLTPHMAGLTNGAKTRAAVRAAKNALAVLAGQVPDDAVNPQAAQVWQERQTEVMHGG